MSIYRSTNPADYDDIDGIVVSESAPPSAVQGAGTGMVILAGQFERGIPNILTDVSSIGEVQELFGKSDTFMGSVALKNKKFANLRIIRVTASAAAKAFKAFASTSVDRITFTALSTGVYGNSITVTIEAGTTVGKKYTVKDTSASAVLSTEIYDNIVITDVVAGTFAASKLVSATVQSTAAEPSNIVATALATGADGTVADVDYQTALVAAEVEGAGDVIVLDACNAVRAGYMKTHAAATQDKLVIVSLGTGDTVAASITAVANIRDTDGRIVYAFNAPKTTIGGLTTVTDPGPWLASLVSQLGPNVDPAYAGNSQYLAGITGLALSPTRSQFISLKNAGVCSFEYDSDIGYKVKSGICTQIIDTSKTQIARRRMADFLTKSVSRFLKVYQNSTNSKDNRDSVKAAILAFVQQQEILQVLPKDIEVKTGKAKLVDTESLNTDTNIGLGYFYVLYKQRIYSSMRYIVLQAQIGETVVVTET